MFDKRLQLVLPNIVNYRTSLLHKNPDIMFKFVEKPQIWLTISSCLVNGGGGGKYENDKTLLGKKTSTKDIISIDEESANEQQSKNGINYQIYG